MHKLSNPGRPAVLACAAALAFAAHAAPLPTAAAPAPRDLGPSTAGSVTVSVALRYDHVADLQHLIDELHTPGDPQFHRFLAPAEFHARFDPAPATVAAARSYFAKSGLAVAQRGFLLDVTGSPAALQRAFGVTLHDYEVAATGKRASYRFHAPVGEPAIADAGVAANVVALLGLDDAPAYAPALTGRTDMMGGTPTVTRLPASARSAAGTPGYWTVRDVASYYHVDPLYAAGLHGEGRTIGIVTLAAFTPSDAFGYWSDLGIATDPDRLTIVPVQGGPGGVSDSGGSEETTLDVQQSGGLAPAARIVVYEAPNNDRTFVDALVRAVEDNTADTLSTSWGKWEGWQTSERMKAKRTNVTVLKAFDQVFMQAAAQGQTVIAAQGDGGAFEVNRDVPMSEIVPLVSVGGPATSPYITSAGGTTLASTMHYVAGGQAYEIDIPAERAWGWDYMQDACAALGESIYDCAWGVGTGGGVSLVFPIPTYQKRIPGMDVTAAGQSLIDLAVNPPLDIAMPAGFAGRNVPDISLNADPNTGYVLPYTDQYGNYGITSFEGGTSFVAPQLNGIAALLQQKTGGRIGLLNYPLYGIARKTDAYGQPHSPFHDITAGANWYWNAGPGYDRASGLGTLDVANFADALVKLQSQ